jgi:prophage regulatory protein
MKPSINFRIIRLKEVLDKIGFSRATLYKQIKDGTFPAQIPLGARAVGWLEHEVDSVISAMAIGKSDLELKQLVSVMSIERNSDLKGASDDS